jgi:hypothetical protein
MKLRSSSTSAAMRLAIPLIAASILPATAQTNVAATAATKVVNIAVPLSDPKGWEKFRDYINPRLQGTCRIEFVPRDPESALFDLMHPDEKDPINAIQGAMLSPFRYVVADLWAGQQSPKEPSKFPSLKLVARMRRVGVIKSDQWEQYQPLASYHSVVLTGQKASVRWPPDTVSISDYRSTSDFIFPFAYFRSEKKLRSKVNPDARRPSVKTPQEAWEIPESRPEAVANQQNIGDDYSYLLDQVKELRVPVISIGDHKLNWCFPDKANRENSFRELYRSTTDIPFDALVIREDAVSGTAMKAIGRAFLSTRDMSDGERDGCFKWTADGQFWRRQPDIHDFIECQDEDYDRVRAAAAKAFGGRVVNIAISTGDGRVHRDLKDLSYFRKWMKDVLRNTAVPQQSPSPAPTTTPKPIYIAIQPRDSDFNVLLDELESGRVHATELNAAYAARAIGRNTGALVGKAFFSKKDNQTGAVIPSDSYHFVILAANLSTDPTQIDKGKRFAYTSKDSSSGYQYPFAWLEKGRRNPAEDLRIEGDNAAGVVSLLVNKIDNLNKKENKTDRFADYGFMADFEWEEKQKQWSTYDLSNIKKLTVDDQASAIPTAYLVFSRVSAPGVNSLGAPSGGAAPKSPSPETELDPSVVASVTAELPKLNQNVSDVGRFLGYKPVPVLGDDLGQLEKFYEQYGNDPRRAGVLLLITLVVFLGAGLGFSFKRRGAGPQTELSIQSLSDILKGVSSHDRNAQKAVTLAVKQLSVLRNATDLSTEKLRRDLESSLLGLLTLHEPKRGTVDDGRYSAALSKLQTATAVTDEQLCEARKSSAIVTNHASSK